MKNILLICTDSKTVVNFRKELISFLLTNDFKVSVIIGDNKYVNLIDDLNINIYQKDYSNRSKNIFSIYSTYRFFKHVIKQVNPDLIFTFQLKPNVFGTLANKNKNIPVINMIEGLGDPFIARGFKGKIVRAIVAFLYKKALKKSTKAIFLNRDDKNVFLKRKLLKEEKIIIIPGIGIDTSNYVPNYYLPKEKRVLYLTRLIKNKGIIEYCEIAKLVREKRKDIYFDLYGEEDELNKLDLKDYIDNNIIYYGGYSTEIKKLITDSRILVSTSYREGFPRIILESMALGRPFIGFDCVGNKDAIFDGKTGYLIKDRSLSSFADKIIELIDDDDKLVTMGKYARNYCENNFDSHIINKYLVDLINDCIKQK